MADNDILDDELDPCPDDEVLGRYVAGNLKPFWVERAIKSHVALCPSCKGRIKNMDRDEFTKRAAERLLERQAKNLAAQREPVAGSVWRTVPETEDELYGPLVLVLEVEKDRLHVAEVSEDIGQALDSDMILDKPKSGLSFRCMVRSGNLFLMKAKKLKGYAGALPDELVERVRGFCLRYDEFKDGIRLSQCRFGKDREGVSLMMREGIISGMPPASDDDPRVKLLEEARERIAYLKKNMVTPTEALDEVVHEVWKGVQGPEGKGEDFQSFKESLHEERRSTRSASIRPAGGEARPWEASIPSVAAPPISEVKPKPRRRYVLVGSIAAGLLAVVVTTAALKQFYQKEEEVTPRGLCSSTGSREAIQPERSEERVVFGTPLPSVRGEADNDSELRGLPLRHSNVPKDLAIEDAAIAAKAIELSNAITKGDNDTVRKLLEADPALVNFPTTSNGTVPPLVKATLEKRPSVVGLLLEHGANVDAVDDEGMTALMWAAQGGEAAIVRLLLSKGADRSLRNQRGKTARDLALESGNKDLMELLRAK